MSDSSKTARSRARRRRLQALALLALAAGILAGIASVRSERSGPVRLPRPPGLGDYWAGRAEPVLVRKWTSTALGSPAGGAYEGAHIEVVGRTWYLFDRRREAGTCAGQADVQPMSTLVRASHDQGTTWGPPVAILQPAAGTPWSC